MAAFASSAFPLQLVLDGKVEDPNLSLVANVDGLSPRSFEKNGRWVPRLGSSAVVALASALAAHNAHVVRFELRDLRLNPLPRNEQDSLSEKLVNALAEGQATITALLEGRYHDVLVTGVEMLVGARRVTVERGGVVITSNRAATIELLKNVWRESIAG